MSKAFDKITASIVAKLESGTVPWRKPWGESAGQMASRNITSGVPYRGINALMTILEGYSSPWWITRKQMQPRGWRIRKGEKGTPIVFWNWIEKDRGEQEGETSSKPKRIPFARLYYAWNVTQLERADDDAQEFPVVEEQEEREPLFELLEQAEDIVGSWLSRPSIDTVDGGRACYSPSRDVVTMPPRWRFEDEQGWYSTLFHELGHSTGHEGRLGRDLTGRPGSAKYAREELVAELTAAFLCGTAGILNEPQEEQTAAYLESWIRVLRQDTSIVPMAAQQAAKAVDHILGTKREQVTA